MSTASSLLENVSFWRRKKTEISKTAAVSTTIARKFDPQRKSMFVNLPEDIYVAILAFLGEGYIPRLIQTSKYLRHVFEPILYRHLILVEGERYLRSSLLHRTLSARSDLIPYIHTYHGPIIPPQYIRDPRRRSAMERAKNMTPHVRTLYDRGKAARVVGIFLQAVNIRNLYFMEGPPWRDDPVRWDRLRRDRLQDAVDNMNLDKLVLQLEGLPGYVAPVLRAQPGLTDLTILDWSTWLGGLVETDVPNLASLKSTLSQASLIVPGRPVEELQLVRVFPEQPLDEYWFKELALSTGPIRKFTMTLHSPSNDDLVRDTIRMIRRYIPSMEHLTLNVRGEISEAVLIEELSAFQFLRRLQILEARLLGSLILTPTVDQSDSETSITWFTPMDQSHRREIINSDVEINLQLKAACPELVDIHWTLYNMYTSSLGI